MHCETDLMCSIDSLLQSSVWVFHASQYVRQYPGDNIDVDAYADVWIKPVLKGGFWREDYVDTTEGPASFAYGFVSAKLYLGGPVVFNAAGLDPFVPTPWGSSQCLLSHNLRITVNIGIKHVTWGYNYYLRVWGPLFCGDAYADSCKSNDIFPAGEKEVEHTLFDNFLGPWQVYQICSRTDALIPPSRRLETTGYTLHRVKGFDSELER